MISTSITINRIDSMTADDIGKTVYDWQGQPLIVTGVLGKIVTLNDGSIRPMPPTTRISFMAMIYTTPPEIGGDRES